MFKFPDEIHVTDCDETYHFQVREIAHNVFAVQNHLHALATTEGLTCGYIVYRDGYVYVCTSEAEDPAPNLHIVYLSYLGPEDTDRTTDDSIIDYIFQTIGFTMVQLAKHVNVHPAILDTRCFDEIHRSIVDGLHDNCFSVDTPYIRPIYDLAREIRDYYVDMVYSLEDVLQVPHSDIKSPSEDQEP